MKPFLFIFVFVASFIALIGVSCSNYVVGSGSKVGTIIQVSNDGNIFKTHELEIIKGGMANGSGGFSTTPFYATINDPGLLAAAQDAFNKQYEVKITYTEYANAPFASDNQANAFVNSIEPVK